MNTRTVQLATALSLAGLLALTGCAPEGTEVTAPLTPGQIGGAAEENLSGKGGITKDQPEELGDIEGRQPVETPKTTVLPDSFPVTEFPLPEGSVIDDAGERSDGAWFVVLRYDSLEAAETALDQIVSEGNFVVTSEDDDSDQIYREFERDAITAQALGFTDESGSFLLSLDIEIVL